MKLLDVLNEVLGENLTPFAFLYDGQCVNLSGSAFLPDGFKLSDGSQIQYSQIDSIEGYHEETDLTEPDKIFYTLASDYFKDDTKKYHFVRFM